ncbi:hypothetical protein OEB99_02460 [Actinotalea sp. M2MS4P-6]|nr:hypothetical protein [Actinotalea sp. M2MS4P-6]MCV2393160.1 hypothetical protein [Actinotalea sp. M2MS4P-6]
MSAVRTAGPDRADAEAVGLRRLAEAEPGPTVPVLGRPVDGSVPGVGGAV